MGLLNDIVYNETRMIALGKVKRSPILIELSEWLMNKYSVKALNIEFSNLITSTAGGFRLSIIIETTKDFQKMYLSSFEHNPEYQSQIAREFQELATKHNFATEEQLHNLYVTYIDFSREAKIEANQKAINKFNDAKKFKYPAVWKVISMFSSTVVFYFRDSDIEPNEHNGLNENIVNDYYSVLKEYDELNYFTRENIQVKFDSKENIDKNYKGSLFYYTR